MRHQDEISKQINEEIALRLNEIRDGSTAADMARERSIKVPTFFRYIHGRGMPSEIAVRICSNLGVNVRWLLTGKGPKQTAFKRFGDAEAAYVNVEVAGRLKEIRGESSINALARACGFSIATLHNYINGRGLPTVFAVRICRALGVNVGWLLTGEGSQWEDLDKMKEELLHLVKSFPDDRLSEVCISLRDLAGSRR